MGHRGGGDGREPQICNDQPRRRYGVTVINRAAGAGLLGRGRRVAFGVEFPTLQLAVMMVVAVLVRDHVLVTLARG